MNACNFQAPNGKNSLLYPGLEQLLGSAKATLVWNQIHSDDFKEKFGDWSDQVENYRRPQIKPEEYDLIKASMKDAEIETLLQKFKIKRIGKTFFYEVSERAQQTVDKYITKSRGKFGKTKAGFVLYDNANGSLIYRMEKNGGYLYGVNKELVERNGVKTYQEQFKFKVKADVVFHGDEDAYKTLLEEQEKKRKPGKKLPIYDPEINRAVEAYLFKVKNVSLEKGVSFSNFKTSGQLYKLLSAHGVLSPGMSMYEFVNMSPDQAKNIIVELEGLVDSRSLEAVKESIEDFMKTTAGTRNSMYNDFLEGLKNVLGLEWSSLDEVLAVLDVLPAEFKNLMLFKAVSAPVAYYSKKGSLNDLLPSNGSVQMATDLEHAISSYDVNRMAFNQVLKEYVEEGKITKEQLDIANEHLRKSITKLYEFLTPDLNATDEKLFSKMLAEAKNQARLKARIIIDEAFKNRMSTKISQMRQIQAQKGTNNEVLNTILPFLRQMKFSTFSNSIFSDIVLGDISGLKDEGLPLTYASTLAHEVGHAFDRLLSANDMASSVKLRNFVESVRRLPQLPDSVRAYFVDGVISRGYDATTDTKEIIADFFAWAIMKKAGISVSDTHLATLNDFFEDPQVQALFDQYFPGETTTTTTTVGKLSIVDRIYNIIAEFINSIFGKDTMTLITPEKDMVVNKSTVTALNRIQQLLFENNIFGVEDLLQPSDNDPFLTGKLINRLTNDEDADEENEDDKKSKDGTPLDLNGEPTLDWVKEKLQLDKQLVSVEEPAEIEPRVVTLEELLTNTIENKKGKTVKASPTVASITAAVQKIYQEAAANPEQQFTIDIPGTEGTTIPIDGGKISFKKLASILDRLQPQPVNLKLNDELESIRQNLPVRFMNNPEYVDTTIYTPKDMNEELRLQQMDSTFVPVRDDLGNKTGAYFTTEKQNAVVGTIIDLVHRKLAAAEQMKMSSQDLTLRTIKDSVKNDFVNARGRREKTDPLYQEFGMVLNSFDTKGGLNFWKLALERMGELGFKPNDPGSRKPKTEQDNKPDLSNLIDGDEIEFQQATGEGLTDWSDNHFEKDPKSTASGRMKMYFAVTPDSKVGREEAPRNIHTFAFNNPQTRAKILRGEKTVTARTLDQAKALKLTTPGQQGLITVEGKQFRLTALRLSDSNDIQSPLKDSLMEEEGVDLSTQRMMLYRLEEFVPKESALVYNRTYLGTTALADYEALYNDTLALLAGQKKDFTNYIRLMKEAGQSGANPNLWALAERLEKAPEEIKNEFLSVVTNQYNEFTMILTEAKPDLDGNVFYILKPTNANRYSQMDVMKENWRQNQKFAPIIVKDETGTTVIDKEKAAELKAELLALTGREGKWNVEAARELMKKVLSYNGIMMTDQALKSFENKALKWTKGTSVDGDFYRQFSLGEDDNGLKERPIGTISALIMKLNGVSSENDSIDDVKEDRSYMVNNPLYTEGTALNILAKVAAAHAPALYSFTHRSSENKTIYDYGYNSLLSNEFRKFADPEFLALFEEVDIARQSYLLDRLKNDPKLAGRMKLTYMDGIKAMFKSNATGVTRPSMSDREQMLTALGLFQNGGNAKYAHYISLTHSDKPTTPIFMNLPRISLVTTTRTETDKLTGEPKLVAQLNPEATNQMMNVFYSEYDRRQKAAAIGSYDDPKYEKGAQYFFFMPEMNFVRMKALVKKGEIAEEVFLAIWNQDGSIKPKDGTGFKEAVKTMVVRRVNKMSKRIGQRWVKLGLVNETTSVFNPEYTNRLLNGYGIYARKGVKNENGKEVQTTVYVDRYGNPVSSTVAFKLAMQLATYDYTVNTFLINTSMSQLLYGDPAQVWKGTIEKTMVDYGKRLAKDLAPGREGAWALGETYNTVTIADYLTSAKYLNEVESLSKHYGAKDSINASDGQELVTVKEHLEVLFKYGKISEKIFGEMMKVVNNPDKDGFYEFKDPAHLQVIMQPMKPVYTGPRAPKDGARLYDYVKPSAYPMYPPFTSGRELNKLRLAMEKDNIARANFESAKKVGQPTNVVKIFDSEGIIDEQVFSTPAWTGLNNGLPVNSARQTLSRDYFRIQQEVPYGDDKESIRTVSQMNKLITESIALIETPFDFKGDKVTADDLTRIKGDIRTQLFQINHKRMMEETGLEIIDIPDLARKVFGGKAIVIKDRSKLLNLLRKRILEGSAGFTTNDLAYLEKHNKDGEGKMVIPLMFSPSASKFEMMIMSLVSDIADIQMPGYSYVQASPAGTGGYKKWEELTDVEKSQIMWVGDYDGSELKTLRPGNTYADRLKSLHNIRALTTKQELASSQLIADVRVDKSQPEALQPNAADENVSAISLFGKRYAQLTEEQQLEAKTHAYRILNELYFEDDTYENLDLIKEFPEYLEQFTKKDNPVKAFFEEELFTAAEKKGAPTALKPAQVLIPFNFIKNGKRESVQDYLITTADGRRIIDPEKVPKELLEIVGARIPNQGHNSMLPMEVVGFVPDNMGDLMIVPAAITKQMGADFDVDKIYAYRRGYEWREGKFQLVNDEEGVLKNDYFDLHWSVLTHPEMLTRILNPLDKPDLEDEAEFITGKAAEEGNEMDFYSSLYQMDDFLSQRDAKQLVGLSSLSTTFNAIIQGKDLMIGYTTFVDKATGYVPVTQPIEIIDEDGTKRTLYRLSGYGKSTYKKDGATEGVTRSKHDNLTSMQSQFLDYAKNRISDKVHLNLATYPAAAALIMLQEEADNGWAPSLKYVTRLMSQPIIKKYAELLSQQEDSFSDGFDPDVKNTVIKKLFQQLRDAGVDVDNIANSNQTISYADLTNGLNAESDPAIQVRALRLFAELDLIGGQMIRVQSALNQDTQGAGPSLLKLMQQDNTRNNLERLFGSSSEKPMIMNVESLFEGTEQGVLYDIIHETAETLVGEYFPYGKLMPVYDKIMKETNRVDMSVKMQKNVFNAMKSYIYSSADLGLWDRPEAARLTLLYNRPDSKSVAVRVQEAKESWGRNNYLLQRLQTDIEPDSLSPNYISYLASKTTMFSDSENTKAWMELLTSEDEEQRRLGEDLIRYNMLMGGLQDAQSFMRYIPYSYLLGTDFGIRLHDMVTRLEEEVSSEFFAEQWFQHNPGAAMKLSADLAELGTLEQYPERFVIPTVNPDAMTNSHPLKRLQIPDGPNKFRYPKYLTYRSMAENKWILYKQVGRNEYVRIDTLGDKNMDEYSIAESLKAPRSLIPSNRSKAYSNIVPQVRMVSGMVGYTPTNPTETTYDMPAKGGAEEIRTVLQKIEADKQIPEHLRLVAAALQMTAGVANNTANAMLLQQEPGEGITPLTFEIFDTQAAMKADNDDTQVNFVAHMDAVKRKLSILRSAMHTKGWFAETLEHELIHDRTSWLLYLNAPIEELQADGHNAETIQYLRDNWNLLTKQFPTLEKSVNQLEEVRAQAIVKLRKEMERKGYSYEQTLKDVREGKPANAYTRLVYATMNLREFAAHALTNTEVMQFLNKHKMEGVERSLLGRLHDIISRMLTAIKTVLGEDVQENSLLEHAVKRTLEVMSTEKMDSTNQAMKLNSAMIRNSMGNLMGLSGNITSTSLTALERMIAKLKEQRNQLIHAQHANLSKEEYAEKTAKIDELQGDIEMLEKSGDFEMLGQIGKRHLLWIQSIMRDEAEQDVNMLMLSSSILDIWRNLLESVYGSDFVGNPDPVFAEVNALATILHNTVVGKQKQAFLKMASMSALEFSDDRLIDVDGTEVMVRGLSSAAKSKVIQYQAMFMETVARRRDQEDVRIAKEIQELEDHMAKLAGGKKNLPEFYNQFMQHNEKENAWGIVQRFSQDWYDYRSELRERRRGMIEAAAKDANPKEAAKRRKDAWKEYWSKINEAAMFADTRYLFDETGERKSDAQAIKHIEELENELGKATTEELIKDAQVRYKDYLEKKKAHDDLIEGEVSSGAKTMDEGAQAMTDFQYRYSPNVFFNNFKSSTGDFKDINSDHFVKMVPKRSVKEGKFYDERYDKIQNDPKLKEVYNKYTELLNKFKKALPVSIQRGLGANFLPVVQQSMIADIIDNFPAYVRTMGERAVNNLTASTWEVVNDQANFRNIPIDYVNGERVPMESRSKDMSKILLMFGMMSNHYSHFAEAKNYIDMGENILKAIHEARTKGIQAQRGKEIITVKSDLKNALDGLQYLKDYLMYKKTKGLQGDTGMKIYSANPIKQYKISTEVEKLVQERADLSDQLSTGEGDPMEIADRILKIDKKLKEYEGRILYGSKIGDQLIKFNQLKTLSYNPFSAIANIAFGMVSAWIHANGRMDFTKGELLKAHKTVLHSVQKWLTFGTVESDEAYKMLAIMDNLGVIGDYVDSHYGNLQLREKKPGWRRAISPYNWMRSGDYVMKSVTVRAMMMHQKVKVTENDEVKEITLWEALDGDGKWDSKRFGENPDWAAGTELLKLTAWDKFKNKTVRVNQIIHGNQDKNSPKLWYKSIWGRLFGQFRLSWLPEGWYARFGEERDDLALGRKTKGRYWTFKDLGALGSVSLLCKQLASTIMNIDPFTGVRRTDGKAITETDIENMRRNLAELGFIMSTVAIILTLRYMADDDDEKRRSTMLVLNTVLRVQQDLTFYSSPMTFDNILRDPIPALKVIKDGWKAAKASVRVMVDDEYEYEQWLNAVLRAGLPIPQATLIPKTQYMLNKDLGDFQN